MAKLEDLREWLLDRIDGGEETRGEDGLISDFIRQIDALPSEMGTIPSDPAATPVTDAVVKMMEAGWLSLGSSAPGAVKPLIETMERMERELIDVKQRLLPQYLGRAQRAEHERDFVVEELIALRSAPSATAATQDAQAIVASCCAAFDCRPSELLGMILGLKGTAPPVEEKAIGHARYEYLRTLNPRKFAALYNEALMGVHQFDDLVDRYRDSKEPSK